MNRSAAYSAIFLSWLLGGGSLLLFLAFLILGPFTIIRLKVPEGHALLWDTFLSMLFFIQHSGMMRTSFRNRLSSIMPVHYHPAVYSIASGVALITLVIFWQTSQTVLFRVSGLFQLVPRAISLFAILGFIRGVQALGSFDPFGRTPIMVRLRGRQLRPSKFTLRGPYLWMRHPLYFFMLVLIWSTPVIKTDRLLFNVLWTAWIIIGSYLEERDLAAEFGEKYRQYQKTVPMLLPWKGPTGRGI